MPACIYVTYAASRPLVYVYVCMNVPLNLSFHVIEPCTNSSS